MLPSSSTTAVVPRVYNSLIDDFVPLLLPGQTTLKWYDCGPTVYDACHLGHGRTYVTLDIVRRIVRAYFGVRVFHVMGMTDIDDKIFARAAATGVTPLQLARRFEVEFMRDMADLGVCPPLATTRVTEHVPDIVDFVRGIQSNGFAYVPPGGDGVYFDTTAFCKAGHEYGKLRRGVDGGGGSGEPGAGVVETAESFKRDPRDFVLWKLAKPGEPSWESPWGAGRPGWHIECSSMVRSLFGAALDVHGGGIDLRFPHHNNEVAQSEAHHNCNQWARVFIHTGHLHIHGKGTTTRGGVAVLRAVTAGRTCGSRPLLSAGLKMSKSLKNFISVRDLLQTHTKDHFRMFCFQYKYRSSVTYSPGVWVLVFAQFRHGSEWRRSR